MAWSATAGPDRWRRGPIKWRLNPLGGSAGGAPKEPPKGLMCE